MEHYAFFCAVQTLEAQHVYGENMSMMHATKCRDVPQDLLKPPRIDHTLGYETVHEELRKHSDMY